MGWPIKKIGEVCDLMTGGTPSKSKSEYFDGGSIKWLVSGDIHKKEILDCDGRITKDGLNNSNAKYLPKNSVMIALNGQGKTRGTVALLRTEATCNQSLVSINPKNSSELLPEFLFMYLHGNYEKIRAMTGDGGNDRRGLNMPLIRSIEIPIAPLPEQKRIVSILDQAFADLEQTRAKTEQNLKNARELFDSYLQQVFSQKGEGWVERELHAVSQDLLQGINTSTDKTVFVDNGIPILQAKELANRKLNLSKCKYISEDDYVSVNDRYKPNQGDLLLNNIGSSLGRCVCVDWGFDFTIAWNVMRIIPVRDIIIPEYLRYVISSPSFQKIIWSKTKGVGMPFISKKNLIEIKVGFPSIQSQHEIVGTLDCLYNKTSELMLLYQGKLDHLDELKKSILQKAFSGELTAPAE